MIVGSRQRINANQDNNMSIRIDDHEINRVPSVKSLGLYIDSHLTWSLHIEKICKKISSAIGALKRIRSCITTKTAIQVYSALTQPHFDYCCSVWDGLGETLSMKIQKLQNRAVFGNLPSYLRTLFYFRDTEYDLRNNQFKLNLPKPRTNYLKQSFSYDGALLWNSLPEEMRSPTLFSQFKKAINDYYAYL